MVWLAQSVGYHGTAFAVAAAAAFMTLLGNPPVWRGLHECHPGRDHDPTGAEGRVMWLDYWYAN